MCSLLVLYSEQGLSQSNTGTRFTSQATVGELSSTQKSLHSILSTAHSNHAARLGKMSASESSEAGRALTAELWPVDGLSFG